MTLFVINIGQCDYAEFSIPLIKKLCDYNKVDLFILENDIHQNIYKSHPSWLKLFCHDLIDTDFILCWDLDLVPRKPYNLHQYLDKTKINLAYDTGALENPNRKRFYYHKKFKYNCGLFGIPKSYSEEMKNIYFSKAKDSEIPSWEQYHVNDYLHDNKIQINEIDTNLNFLYNKKPINDKVLNLHYTYRMNPKYRYVCMKNDYKIYNDNFIKIPP